MVDRKSSRIKTFSKNMIYMFCLYHFSVKCIIKKIYLPSYSPLNCGVIIFSMTTSGSLPMTETVVNTIKVKPITLNKMFYLFYNESLIVVINCPNLQSNKLVEFFQERETNTNKNHELTQGAIYYN